jgi:type I restriction enzyme R subunit
MILNNDNKYRGNLGNTLKLDEYSKVEKPLMEQLIGLGWNTADNEVIELQMQQVLLQMQQVLNLN